MATIVLTNESGTPATPSAGVTKVYTRNGNLHILDSSGTPRSVNSSGITAGPSGSGATYTGTNAISNAVTAVAATAPCIVEVLPGVYPENVTLPAGVSLVAAFGTVELNGTITLTGLNGFQTVSGFIFMNLYLNAGATSSAAVLVNQCQIHGNDTDPAVAVSDDGWEMIFSSCGVEGDSQKAVSGSDIGIQGSNTTFKSNGDSAIETAGSLEIQQCTLEGGVNLSGTARAELVDTNIRMPGSAPYVFSLGGTSQLSIQGGFSVSGVDSATGTLWTGSGTFSATSGTFLGAYNSGALPTVNMGSEGCIAYALDMQTLAVVANGNWEPVGGGGGGGIPDPGGETPGAMLYFRSPGMGGDWDLVQHSRDGAGLKFSQYNNNGSPYWDYPQTPKNFTLLYESIAVDGVDPYNVPAQPGGMLPLPVATWTASMVGGGTALTAPGGSEPTWNNQQSVVFTTGKVVSGTPTVVEAPSGGNARTLCLVFDNALGATPGTNIVSYGNGWTTLSPAGEGFGIVVLANGNLGFSAGGGSGFEVDFGFSAASVNRRLIMVAYDGSGMIYWSLNGSYWSAGSPMVLNTGGGGGSVATPLIIGGTGASYAIQNVTLYNQDLHNNQGMVNQFLSYCANALGMPNGSTMTIPGGEFSPGTLFYYSGGQGLSVLTPGTPTNILTVGMMGYPQWSAAPSPSSTLTNGPLSGRTAGTVGQQYLVADEGGPSHGDLYVCAQANRWELTGYNRTYYPHSPSRYWTMTYTAMGPTFPNTGSLGGAEDLMVTGGFNTGLSAGFGSIASQRTRFTGTAGATGGTPPTSTGAVTLAIWYKPTANTGTITPILACVDSDTAPTKGMGIWQDTTVGSIIITANNQTLTIAVPSEIQNQDNLLVLTWDKDHVAHNPTELVLFVNGQPVSGINMGGPTLLDWTGCTWVVGNFGITALSITGELCQAACFDGTILSDNEIQDIFERGVGTYTGH